MSDSQHSREVASSHWRPEETQLDSIALATDRIAHDFNNLLSVIISNLDLLERRISVSEPSYRCVDRSLKAALKCAEYTEELLSYSRKHSQSSAAVNANDSIRKCVSSLLNGACTKVELSLHPDLWAIRVNPEDFSESLKALLRNATEATGPNGRVIVTSDNVSTDQAVRRITRDVPPGEYIVIQVVDNGVGMGTEVLRRAVDPFFSTKASAGHNGMGLSRVFGFLRRSRGHLEINSKVGTGTSIRMYLPRDSQYYPLLQEGD